MFSTQSQALFMVCMALLLFLATANAATTTNIDSSSDIMNTREKRAVDFGILLRNLLLKSAQLSSAKYATPMPRTTRTTTTTTTTQAPPAPPTRRRRPNRPLPPWPGHYYYPDTRGIGGYLPFDYDDYAAADYADDAEEPSTTTTTARPMRTRKPQQRPRPPPPPPPPTPLTPVFYRQPYEQRSIAAQPPPPPRRRRPRPQPSPAIPRQSARPPQLSDNLIYQYAQSNDIYFNDDGRTRYVDRQGQQPQESEAEPRNAKDQEAVENENGENDNDNTGDNNFADDEEDNLDLDNNNNTNNDQGDDAAYDQGQPSAQINDNFNLNNPNPNGDTRFIIRYVNAADDYTKDARGAAGGSVDEAFSAAQIQQPKTYGQQQQLQDASNIQFGDFQTSYFGESSAAGQAPGSYYYGVSRN